MSLGYFDVLKGNYVLGGNVRFKRTVGEVVFCFVLVFYLLFAKQHIVV